MDEEPGTGMRPPSGGTGRDSGWDREKCSVMSECGLEAKHRMEKILQN